MRHVTFFQMSSDTSLRKEVFRYHLIARSGGKKFRQVERMHPPTVSFDRDGYWSDVLKRQFVFARGNVTCLSLIHI